MDMQRVRTVLLNLRLGKTGARQGQRKLSRADVSARTETGDPTMPKIHAQTIRNIEKGEIHDPGFITILRLIEAMGLTLQDFCHCLVENEPAASLATSSPGEVVSHETPPPVAPPPLYTLDDFKVVATALTQQLVDAIERIAQRPHERPPDPRHQPPRRPSRRRSDRPPHPRK